jgi:hypothetical protein
MFLATRLLSPGKFCRSFAHLVIIDNGQAGSHSVEYKKKSMWLDATITETKSFEKWVRPKLQNVEDAKWHFVMANYMFSMAPDRAGRQYEQQYREACRRCEEAFGLDPSRWDIQILSLQILSRLKDYEACIRVLNALRETMTPG